VRIRVSLFFFVVFVSAAPEFVPVAVSVPGKFTHPDTPAATWLRARRRVAIDNHATRDRQLSFAYTLNKLVKIIYLSRQNFPPPSFPWKNGNATMNMQVALSHIIETAISTLVVGHIHFGSKHQRFDKRQLRRSKRAL